MPTNWRAKRLVAQVSKYLLNGYFMPGTLSGTIFIFWAAQEWEKLSQTFSSISGNCALTTPYADGSPIYDSSSPFSLPPRNQCVWLPSGIFSGMSSRHLTLTCPLETGGRTEMTRAWREEKWGVSVEWVQSLCLEWWESLGTGQWWWPQHCECTSYD